MVNESASFKVQLQIDKDSTRSWPNEVPPPVIGDTINYSEDRLAEVNKRVWDIQELDDGPLYVLTIMARSRSSKPGRVTVEQLPF